MGTPFLAEVRLISFNFAPKGWALCSGQLLPINQNQALFSLLGTTYGGDGRVNFALPDLRGKVPIHVGQGFVQGQVGGEIAHTLTQSEMPAHNHILQGSSNTANLVSPTNGTVSGTGTVPIYVGASGLTTLRPDTISNVGGSQAHNNMQPYSVVTFIIALQGTFPSRN